jgi:hypothetical protein
MKLMYSDNQRESAQDAQDVSDDNCEDDEDELIQTIKKIVRGKRPSEARFIKMFINETKSTKESSQTSSPRLSQKNLEA